MKLKSGWYAVLDSSELKKGKPCAFTRFGRDLVFWRDAEGRPVAMDDRCPHRAAKLSLGKIVDSRKISCPFHGFEFDADGSCLLVPETGKAAPNLRVTRYELKEEHGFVWLYWGANADPEEELPWFSELKDYKHAQMIDDWPCQIGRCIENQLDYAHLPFVHKSTIGGRFDPKREVRFELSDKAIKFFPAETAFIEFRFPNIWRNYITKDFQITLAFVPVSKTRTRLYLRTYAGILNIPLLGAFLRPVLNLTNGFILNQDRRVVLSQSKYDPLNSAQAGEILYPSDRAIAHYRKLVEESAKE